MNKQKSRQKRFVKNLAQTLQRILHSRMQLSVDKLIAHCHSPPNPEDQLKAASFVTRTEREIIWRHLKLKLQREEVKKD